jgi:transcriptional regulator with XRE-family HTH domain
MQEKPDTFLAELAGKLRLIRRRKLATQQEIESKTGVDQTTVSRVMNLERRRVTPALRELMKYADMLLEPKPLSTEVSLAAYDFLRSGGSEAELVASIEHAARLVSRRRVPR